MLERKLQTAGQEHCGLPLLQAHMPPTLTHQQGISDEENGGVVACQVPVALLSVKFDCKASGVSHCVC